MLKYAIEVATHKGATRYCKKMAVDMASLFWPPDSAITATIVGGRRAADDQSNQPQGRILGPNADEPIDDETHAERHQDQLAEHDGHPHSDRKSFKVCPFRESAAQDKEVKRHCRIPKLVDAIIEPGQRCIVILVENIHHPSPHR